MCSIAGLYDPQRKSSRDAASIVRGLLDGTKHRGPDSHAIKYMGNVTLGANRLAIVGVQTGSNPLTFHHPDGDVEVALNGEIYNWKELRKELEDRGYVFTTDCDTEVVGAAWKEWGVDFVKKLDGMFAIMLKDTATDTFVVATDPMNIKPLHYVTDTQGRTIYCSEALPLQGLAARKGEVHKVEQGQIIVNGHATKYYDILRPPIADTPPTKEELRDLVIESVLSQLPPKGEKFGVFLSSGFDSGAIASIAALNGRKDDLVVFISGAAGSPDAEGGFALAKELGLPEDNIVRVELNAEKTRAALPAMVRHFGQYDYFQISNGVNFWFCAEEARKRGIKVALCGDGSDEIFAGYDHYRRIMQRRAPHFYENNPPSKDDLLRMEEISMRHCLALLHNERIACVDSMAMAHSVEVRPPFLRTKLVNAGLSIPMDDKIDITDGVVTRGKSCVREALRGVIPDRVVDSKKLPGYIGAQTFASQDGINPYLHPFDPIRDKGTVRALMREEAIKMFGSIDGWKTHNFQGWPVGCPEEAYLFVLWQKDYPDMASAYDFHAQQGPLSAIHYFDRVVADPELIPADARIATRHGVKRASQHFPKHKYGPGGYKTPVVVKTPSPYSAAAETPSRLDVRFGSFYAHHRRQHQAHNTAKPEV